MNYLTIIYEQKGHIAYITLKRAGDGIVANQQFAGELNDVCQEIIQNEKIHVVVITGTGNEIFYDSAETGAIGDQAEIERQSVASFIAAIDCPVIAAINGDACGQGLELALACDIRIASRNARFGFPEVAQGLIPMDGGTQRLPRIIGRGKALELVFTGDIIDADEALEIGLISKVVDSEDLMDEANALANSLNEKAPIALRYVKEAVNKGMDLTLEQGLRLETDLYLLIHTTEDRTEGIRAFQEKRTPRFEGK